MPVSKEKILEQLPPFRNEMVLVKRKQEVSDIIEQILKAHVKYAHYYDNICSYFNAKNINGICDDLYKFVQKNVKYKEESEEEQTTALPSAILAKGHGDCKHYSLFTAGILDALNRTHGRKINWCYRFASYKPFIKTPHHVFVVVKQSNGEELWIDAVPGANKLTPVWQVDYKPKVNEMPLYDVIGNTGGNTVGWTPTTADKLAHSIAKTNPLFIAGRAAFIEMLKLNVKAWAKNLAYLIETQGTKATDQIGYKWYMLGGTWQNLVDAIYAGRDKKMIGNTIGLTGVEITAMITAAAPVIIAMTSVIKSLINKNDWEQGQLIPGMPTGYTPLPPSTTGADFLKSPIVLAAGAGLLYYMYSGRKKVNGANDNFLLLLLLAGGGYYMYNRSKQQQQQQEQTPIDTSAPTDEALTEQPIFLPPNDGGGSGGYGGGGGKEIYTDNTIPIEAVAY